MKDTSQIKIHGIPRLKKAFGYSIQGLRLAWQYEDAFRLEIYVLIFGIPLAYMVGESATDYILLIGSLLLLITIELINSAIEAICDKVSLTTDELIGRSKDFGAAAVFVAIVTTLGTWTTILLRNWL